MKLPRDPGKAFGPLAIGSLVAATLAVATVVSQRFFEAPITHEPAARPPPGAAADPASFRVSGVEGPVEAFHGGRWYVVQAGDLLGLQDVLRTPRGSRVLLRRGSVEIEVREEVDIRLDSLAAETARFDVLRGGNVVANVGADAERLEITARETRSVNEGTARWIVSLGPTGQVSVAASQGTIRFAAAGTEVQVPEGHESTAAPGRAPSDPETIPEDLFLSVIWPEVERTENRTDIAGRVSPSSQVKVNGVPAPVGPDGRFVASVPLAVGANRVQIEAQDITGRRKAEAKVLRRTPRAPVLEASDEELWKR